MTWRLVLKNEAEIRQIATAQIDPTKEAAAVLGGSGNCRPYSRNHWIRFLIDPDDKAPFGLSV